MQAVLRRTASDATPDAGPLTVGDIVIDPLGREVHARGQTVVLTSREFDLLLHFARHPRQVFTREQLLAALWDRDFEGDPGTVTVHLRRLRTKIEEDPSRPLHLKTVWGVGYKFEG